MSVNKAILIGRCGKDPETRFMTNGEAATNVSIATSETWKDKSGEKQEKTEWHNLVFYKRLAEVVGEYVKKGSEIYVEGKIQTRKWQDKEGKDRYITEIVCHEMKMLGGKKEASDESQSKQSKPAKPQATEDFPDDVPFAHHGKRGAGVDWRSM